MQESGSLESLLEEKIVNNSTVKFVYGFLLRHDFGNTAEILAEEAKKMGFTLVENEVEESKIMSTDSCKNTAVNCNRIPIVPNDRQIPVFIDGMEEEKETCSAQSLKQQVLQRNVNEKSVVDCLFSSRSQAKHCGVQTLHSNLRKSGFNTDHLQKPLLSGSGNSKMAQELMSSELRLHNITCNYERLKLRFHKLHADYHKLIGIAAELTAALESSVKGEAVDLQAMLESCIKIFPDLFNSNIRENMRTSELKMSQMRTNSGTIDESNFANYTSSPTILDFKKIKLNLINGNLKAKLFLLQALRWKITLSRTGEQDEVIHEYISNDLFGLHGRIASDKGQSVLPYLMKSENTRESRDLRQSTARILNALASFRCGRDYLSVGTATVLAIIDVLNLSDGVDELTRDMLLATLQKLSLRRQQRLYMIKNGLVEWLICHLHRESHRMSSYGLEYATALLMNLSLHSEARTKASAIASLVITALISLLSVDRPAVLPYVNGSLNNFLSNRVINEEAKKARLSSILEYYQQRKTGEIRKHFDHILKVHKREYTDSTENEDTADEDNEEFDVLENEIDEEDPVRIQSGDLYGEALLRACYSISPCSLSLACSQQRVIPERRVEEARSGPVKQETYLYINDACRPLERKDNVSRRESRETTASSTMTLASARESRATDVEKFSSIASL